MVRVLIVSFIIYAFPVFVVAQDKLAPKCPTISVTGPAGEIPAGDTMTFTANVSVDEPDKLGYKWNVSGGTIEDGIGKPSIIVRIGRESIGTRIEGSVEITGLERGCPNKGSAEGKVYQGGDPPMLDEFGRLSLQQEQKRTDEIAKELAKYPSYILYVILYLDPKENKKVFGTIRTRIRARLLSKHGISADRLVFVFGGSDGRRAKFYAVPPEKKDKTK